VQGAAVPDATGVSAAIRQRPAGMGALYFYQMGGI